MDTKEETKRKTAGKLESKTAPYLFYYMIFIP